jgi:hypothetical protein
MEDLIWADNVTKKEILGLHGVMEERNIPHTIKRREATWVCHILCRTCRLKYINEQKIEGTGTRRRRKDLLDNIKETKGTGILNMQH